jgi:large subunit ribosomal protein L20
MARVKRGVVAGRRHKKILKKAKGYFNARRKVFRTAKQAVIKAGQYAYRGRREKKREFRALWITRINAAARLCGMTYSTLIDSLTKAEVAIDRKVLADLAMHDMPAFTAIVERAKAGLSGSAGDAGHAGNPAPAADAGPAGDPGPAIPPAEASHPA